ncbi:hypothetical protein GmHk_20G057803 [Glycine max]|nr:hypothetical protein GmHk_20G057803 [Glycine max]KAH1190181.1 hypothetical protein GmHk_20G057803 [Glycine max]KAH1190182.1 hypothetical protein GmHk_20G057803 [Glycine max]
MTTPPSSLPLPPPTGAASQSSSTLKQTRKATRLRSLATRPVGAERPLVHVDPTIGKANDPHKKKLRTYLGIVARDKVDVTYENWKQVPTTQKDLIWEDIQASQGSFVAHGRPNVLTVAIGQPEHHGRVCAARVGVTIKQYFGPDPRTSRTSSSMAPEDLEQLICSPSFNRKCNHRDSHFLLILRLYVEENPPRLVALGRLYVGSTTIHNIPLLHDQVKFGVEEVRDADAPILIPTEEVKLVGQTLNTLFAWPTYLVKHLSKQGAMGPAKPAVRPDHHVNDPLYLMTLTIPQLFLKLLQVMWDTTVFRVFNDNFPLYIKHENLSEIAHSGQCLNISVIHLWIIFLEPRSIQRFGQSQFELESYIKNWMQKSKRDVYLGAYLNGAHWQMVVILPKENVVI